MESANISSLHFNCTTNCATVLSRFTAGAQSPISYLGHSTELVQWRRHREKMEFQQRIRYKAENTHHYFGSTTAINYGYGVI